jgi:TonB dependent receptor
VIANPNTASPFLPFLGCYDLTRATPALSDGCRNSNSAGFFFRGHTDVKLLSLYLQNTVTKGKWSFNLGLRGDLYNGLAAHREVEPRLGLAYDIKKSNTVLRLSYARALETPFNENLVLSSTGCGSEVIAALVPCVPAAFSPGWRNEFHAGVQQAFGKYLVFSGEYIWKYTHNAYDFSVLGSTPITFPIEWRSSKIPGFAGRVSVPNVHGFTALMVFSSVAARFFPPQIGGLGTTVGQSGLPFRIDRDESSIKPLICSISPGSMARGQALIGGMTVGRSLVRCRLLPIQLLQWMWVASRRMNNCRQGCFAEASARR